MEDEAVCAYHILRQLEIHRASNGREWLPVRKLRQQIKDAGVGPVTFRKVLEALQWTGEIELSRDELLSGEKILQVRLARKVEDLEAQYYKDMREILRVRNDTTNK